MVRKILSLLMVLMVVLSLCACQKKEIDNTIATTRETETSFVNTTEEAEETTVPAVTIPDTITVELTPENFGEYFEIYHDCFFQENAFGDISAGMMPWGICLKDVFQPYLKQAEEIAVEIETGFSFIEYEIDYDNRKINLIAGSEIPTDDRYTYVCDLAYNESTSSIDSQVAFLVPSATRQACRYPTEVTVLRAIGTLVFDNTQDLPVTENSMPFAEQPSTETEEIELTLYNWDTYFEFAEVPSFTENVFGEVDTFNLYFQFRLKEEYLERLNPENSNIAVEASYTYGHRYCTVDYEAQTYELREYENTGKTSKMGELFFHSDGGYYFADFGVNPEFDGNTIFAYSNFEVLRITGVLCLDSN